MQKLEVDLCALRKPLLRVQLISTIMLLAKGCACSLKSLLLSLHGPNVEIGGALQATVSLNYVNFGQASTFVAFQAKHQFEYDFPEEMDKAMLSLDL